MNKKLSIILAGFLIVNPVIPVFAEELPEKSSIVESSDATDTSTSREEKVQSTTESASNNEEEVNLDSVELDASVENDPADGIEVEQAVEFDQQQNDTSITIPTPYADNITGKWGTVPWTYNTVTGELVFTGSGTLSTSISYAPWQGLNSSVPYSSITKIIFQKKVTVLDGYSLFAYGSNKATNLTSIEGLENLDTSEATDMSEMFSGLVSVTALDVSSLDTSNVTKFRGMFSGCKSLNNLDLSNFNTSKAKSFDFMFFDCQSLTNLNVTSFNTSNATSMMGMFSYCSSLPTIYLSNFNTSNVTNFQVMFQNCESLETIELNSFNTSKVRNMVEMFKECNSLKTLDLSSFDTTNVLQKNYMLEMSSLRSVTLGEKTIIKGTGVQYIDTSDGIYTGRWIKEPDASVIYESSDKFMYNYDGSSPGTYTWEKSEESLVIDFDSNGGSSIPSQMIVANETLTKPTDPTKEGYTFAGWYVDEALTQLFDFDKPITQATTLYAKWTETGLPIGNYPVDFNSNGGSSIPSQLIVANETLTKPTDPTKEGYTFAGWYVDEALTQLFDFDKPITQATTLYAKWTETGLPIGNYPVDFNSNGGSSIPSQLIVANETLTKPTDPTKEGYTFAGWYVDEALTQLFDFDKPITQATTLYAKWTETGLPIGNYPVDFNSNGGSSIPSQLIVANETLTKPTDPTKEGYTFAGWYTDEALTQPFDFDTPITQVTTLYAKWTETGLPIGNYPVDFDSNGGSSIPSQMIVANETLTKPTDPTKEGYTFAGWYVDEALTQLFDFDKPITQATTLYAKWTETGLPIGNYPVDFNSNGGSSIPSQMIVANETLTKPTDPTKEGYTFAGWYTDEALTQPFDFDTPITQVTTLYAKWTETGLPIGNYPVDFDSNGGSSIPSQMIVANETLTKPTDPTKEGYTFAGWYVDEALTQPFDFDTPITQVTTLYAKWTETGLPIGNYPVDFDSNGGSSIPSQMIVANETLTKPTDPTKEGYTFAGWYVDEALTQLFDFDKPITQATTLYAKWTKIDTSQKNQSSLSKEKNASISNNSSTGKQLPSTGETNSFIIISLGLLLFFVTSKFMLRRNKLN